jgi:hypothetical protein
MTSKLQNYRVLRGHEGDRTYAEGETRQADPNAVGHLVGRVLEPMPGGRKAEPAPRNKAEGAAPANKASTGRKAKQGPSGPL